MSTDDDDYWFAKRQFIANASRPKPEPKSRKGIKRESLEPRFLDKHSRIKDEMLRDLSVPPAVLRERLLAMGISRDVRWLAYVRAELKDTIRLLKERGYYIDS